MKSLSLNDISAIINGSYHNTETGVHIYRSDFDFAFDIVENDKVYIIRDYTYFYIDEQNVVSALIIDKNITLGKVNVFINNDKKPKLMDIDSLKVIKNIQREGVYNLIIKELYLMGSSTYAIGKQLGVRPETIARKLTKMGIYKNNTEK